MSQHRRLVLRFSLLFRASPCESFRLLRNDTDSGISYPNQHIDSECLLRTCYFRASVHYDTLRRQCFSSSIDGRAIRLPSEGMHHEHLCLRSSCKAKHAAWGAIDLAFRIFHAGDLFFVIFIWKSGSFSLVVPYGDASLLSPVAPLSRIEGIRRHILTMEKFCWLVSHIDGVLEGRLPFSYEPLREEA